MSFIGIFCSRASNQYLKPCPKNPNKRHHSPNSSDSSWDQPRKKVSFSASLNEHVTLDDIDKKIVMRKESTSIEKDECFISRGILRKSSSRSANMRSPPHPSASSSSYPSNHLSPDEYQYQRHGTPGNQRTSPFPQRYPQGFSPQSHSRRSYNDSRRDQHVDSTPLKPFQTDLSPPATSSTGRSSYRNYGGDVLSVMLPLFYF